MDWNRFIDEMSTGYRNAIILAAANQTGILDLLGRRRAAPAEVARELELDERATDIVVRALAAAGVLAQDGDVFALQEGARPFLTAAGERTKASIIGHNLTMMKSWIQLPQVLRTGRPAERAERTDQELRDFICGMQNVSRTSSVQVADRIDLGGVGWLLDLGGGPATAAITFARRHPRMRCVVMDLPGPIAIAREQITAAGLADRIDTAAGDFLQDPWPAPPQPDRLFDAVYVSNIIHSLSEAQTLQVFATAHGALAPNGRILVKDFFLEDDRTAPAYAAQFSVNMLVATEQGKSYTLSETRELLRRAGFGGFRAVEVAAHSRVLEARRES